MATSKLISPAWQIKAVIKMEIANYIKCLTNQIFKALPMRQDGIDIEFLMQHMNSVYIDAMGYKVSNPCLAEDRDFQTVVNIVAYLGNNPVDEATWKREILKATHLLNNVEIRFGGGSNG